MAVELFITGPYSSTWNAVGLGLSKGYEITHEHKTQEINETDLYGDTMVDGINRGMNVTVDFTLLAYSKAVGPLNPFTANHYTAWASTTPVGRLLSSVAQALVMTAQANTPAAGTLGPATLTANLAIVAPNFSTKYLMDSKLREVPLKFQLLPYTSSGSLIFATQT